ncbi:MAG: hypothetical protein CVV41_02965 [Candidatus Riflebacteria bacterium HGW-Riflebacteria-1]|jgi:hypothetical protein|nr:MAG: hypothetical protein CVV41_02965 [Candidatus Riflebacteria bacterium HGW-Riflebacteria-1]
MKRIFVIVAVLSFVIVLSAMLLLRKQSQPEKASHNAHSPIDATKIVKPEMRPPPVASESLASSKIVRYTPPKEAFVPQTSETTRKALKEVLAISISRMENSK